MVQPLENILAELDQQEEVQEVFAVVDLETAAEAQRRIAYFESRKTEIDSIIEKQIAPFLEKIEKIKMWGEEAKKEHIEKQAHYSNQLERYIREEVKKQVDAGKKPKKTIKLPYGSISLKKQQPKFTKDDLILFDYAKENGFVRVKEETDWAALKKQCQVVNGQLVDEFGVIVPGVEVVEQDEKFDLKLE